MELSFTWHKYRIFIGFLPRVVRTPAETGKQASSGNESGGIRERNIRSGSIGACTESGKGRGDQPVPPLSGRFAEQAVSRPEEAEYLFQLTLTVICEIKPGIRAAARDRLGRMELILTLRRLLKKYAPLTASRALPFRVAINNVIVSEAANHCSIHLDKEELLTLWRPAG